MRSSIGIKDVARRAGVSVGTVSNVLNRPEIVAESTRDRVLAAINELGFVRNETARQLRVGRGRTIGLVILDVANPFFTDVARGVEEVAEANDISLTLCSTGENRNRELRHLHALEQQRVLGILLSPVEAEDDSLDELVGRGTSVVLVDRESKRGRCSVSVDSIRGGFLAVDHLLGAGHRRVAFVGGPLTIRQGIDRLRGAKEAFLAAGLSEDDLFVIETASFSVASGRAAAAQVAEMRQSMRPTAAFCANDLLALGFLQGIMQHGLLVPEDVAIVGYDDIEFAAAAAIPLTSVRQPREELGRVAMQLILEEVAEDSEHKHRQVRFQPELIVRQSTMVPVVPRRAR